MGSEKKSDEDTVYLFVDMQNAVILPRIPGVKTAVFTKRLIVFHETFATLGSKSCGNPFGAIPYEGIDRRSAEELASTYSKIFRQPKMRDYENIVLSADNCSVQNKNWVLYSMICHEVNR